MANLQNNKITPGLRWNPDLSGGRYIGKDGTIVSVENVKSQINGYIKTQTDGVRNLAEQLKQREITIAEFQESLAKAISNTHMAGTALAKGGWAQMTPSDYGKAAQFIKQQYGGVKAWNSKGLRGFAADIESGAQKLDGLFVNRALMYVKSANHTYEAIRADDMVDAGMTKERSIRHVSDSCDECVETEDEGWSPIGTLPLPGERQCMSNCCCTMDYK